MADYHDAEGNPIDTGNLAVKSYHDYEGKPVQQPSLESTTQKFQAGGKTVASLAANALPFAGSFLGPLGTLGGFSIQHGLQMLSPSTFGQPSEGLDIPFEGAKDVLLQNAIPSLVGKGLGVARDAIENGVGGAAKNLAARILSSRPFKSIPSVSTAIEQSGIDSSRAAAEQGIKQSQFGIGTFQNDTSDNILQNAAYDVKNRFNIDTSKLPKGLQSTLGESPQFAKDSLGRDLLDTFNNLEASSTVKLNKRVLSSPEEVRQFKLLTGNPQAAEQLALNDVLKGNTPDSFDPDRIVRSLNGDKADVYFEAISPTTRKSLINLTDTLKQQQEILKGLPDTAKEGYNVLTYIKHRLVWDAGEVLLGGAVGGGAGLVGGATTVVLGNMAVKKLMSNPEIANLTVQAAKTGLKAPEAGLISHVILNTLKGTEIYLTTPEGGQEKVVVGQDGRPLYPQKP